jgi:DNA-binding XRE family transcriptional regulator
MSCRTADAPESVWSSQTLLYLVCRRIVIATAAWCFVVTTADDLNHVLAANLRRLRTKLGLSQEAFAERCSLHRTYVGAIERGERNVTLNTLEHIAETLGVAAVDLLKPHR